jgi:aspartate racemase
MTMKTIGLLGGMSWESTREYYRMLNEGVRESLGGLHSAKLLMHSFDFAEIAALQHSGRWKDLEKMLADAAKNIEQGGADAIIICTNLMHKLAYAVEGNVSIPLLHIADAIAESIKADGFDTVGLLGARYTMQEPFYAERLKQHGINTIIPDDAGCEVVHRMIYDELCRGKFTPESKKNLRSIIDGLHQRGAGGVILGCTELPILLSPSESAIPLYDSMELHAQAALTFSLSDVKSVKAA